MLAAAWLIAVQLFSSGVGGYLAGRLRARWVNIHTDEAYFRDTAHGLLVWAVGAIIGASLLASAASSLIGGAAHSGAAAIGAASGAVGNAASQIAASRSSTTYFSDMLFRSDRPNAGDQSGSQAEVGRIFVNAMTAGELPAADKTYLAHTIAARTGIPDAEKRVSDVFEQAKAAEAKVVEKAKEAADAARTTGVYVALWAFISLLVGAFSASYMAMVGGSAHDEYPAGESRRREFRAVPRSG